MSAYTVLVVDDDYRVAGLHCEAVRSVPGFEALPPAGSLTAARAALRDAAPDLLLVDQYVPDGLGTDLLRETDADSLLVTADRSPRTTRLALARGALGVLYKPFESSELTSRLTAYARFRRILDGTAEMDQDVADRALRALAVGIRAAQEPAAESATLARLREILAAEPEGLTASQVAAKAGVSRPTAQRHLASAARSGEFVLELKYGTTGRPEHIYRSV